MLIVGDPEEPHTAAVLQELAEPAVVIDASSFACQPLTLTSAGIEVAGTLARGRGWIRRLAPPGWADTAGGPTSVEAAERSAGLSALAAVLHDERIRWLTPIAELGVSENKPWQYRLAEGIGACVPEWVVTTDPNSGPRGGGWVIKPLGPGGFVSEDVAYVVPTTAFSDDHRPALARAPFMLQRIVPAAMHARVVTVGESVYSALLEADGLPIDWRMSADAHRAFTDTPVPDDVAALARCVARTAGLGYSAQDWIRGRDGRWWFIDLNPAGQWLFLPDPTANSITKAIADLLMGAA